MSILKTDLLKLFGLTALLLLVPLFANQTVQGSIGRWQTLF